MRNLVKRYKLLSIARTVEATGRLSSLKLFDQLRRNSVTRLYSMMFEKDLRNHFSIFMFFTFSRILHCKKCVVYTYTHTHIYICYIYVIHIHIHNRFSISITDIAISTGARLPVLSTAFSLDLRWIFSARN